MALLLPFHSCQNGSLKDFILSVRKPLPLTALTRSLSLISSTPFSRTASLHTSFHVWLPAPLNLMFYKCCMPTPALFFVYAYLKLTGGEILHLQLLTRCTPPLLKSSPPLLDSLFCDGPLIPNLTSTSVYARILLDELHVDAAVASLPRYTLKAFGQVPLPLTISSIQTNGLSLVKPFLHLVLIDFVIVTRTPRCPPLRHRYGALAKVPLSTVSTT